MTNLEAQIRKNVILFMAKCISDLTSPSCYIEIGVGQLFSSPNLLVWIFLHHFCIKESHHIFCASYRARTLGIIYNIPATAAGSKISLEITSMHGSERHSKHSERSTLNADMIKQQHGNLASFPQRHIIKSRCAPRLTIASRQSDNISVHFV
jgi:hypothetical protein